MPALLRIVCDTTGLGYACIGRVTDTTWTACAVLDRMQFGVLPGQTIAIETTFCRTVRATRTPVVIDHAAQDPDFCAHPAPERYGIQSYISVPIMQADGRVFGTICAFDRAPTALRNTQALPIMQMFAELVAAQIDVEQRLEASRSALIDAAEAALLREQFVAVLGHDLRNPVAAIASGLTLLERGALDQRAAMVVAQMRQSCRRINALIDDTLDFARGRLGDGIPLQNRQATALNTELTHVVDELRQCWPGRLIATEFELDELVYCDAMRIGQLVSNLVGNALTHGTPDQPVVVRAVSDARHLRLSVRNGGPAIPPGTMARLFRPFNRGRTAGGGLGLGLFIASEIARSHGGTLDATSTPQQTEFTFQMPNSVIEPVRL